MSSSAPAPLLGKTFKYGMPIYGLAWPSGSAGSEDRFYVCGGGGMGIKNRYGSSGGGVCMGQGAPASVVAVPCGVSPKRSLAWSCQLWRRMCEGCQSAGTHVRAVDRPRDSQAVPRSAPWDFLTWATLPSHLPPHTRLCLQRASNGCRHAGGFVRRSAPCDPHSLPLCAGLCVRRAARDS